MPLNDSRRSAAKSLINPCDCTGAERKWSTEWWDSACSELRFIRLTVSLSKDSNLREWGVELTTEYFQVQCYEIMETKEHEAGFQYEQAISRRNVSKELKWIMHFEPHIEGFITQVISLDS